MLPGQPRPIRVEVIPESQLSNRELSDYDVVVLCNVDQFIPREVAALEDFLNQGGGVVFFGGDQVLPDNYNRQLYADGNGHSARPDRPERRRCSQDARAGSCSIPSVTGIRSSPSTRESPIPVTAGITQARTWQYHKLVLPKDTKAEHRDGLRERRSGDC